MRILIHYPNILNSLLRVGPAQPSLDEMDYLWDALGASDLEVFISERGLRTMEQDFGIAFVAGLVKNKLRKALKVCPSANTQEVKDFARIYNCNNYEEAFEVYSAHLVSAQAILTNRPQGFSSFGMQEILLQQGIDKNSFQSNGSRKFLPILILGNFPDINFLLPGKKTKFSSPLLTRTSWIQQDTHGSKGKPGIQLQNTCLSGWYLENRFESGWHTLDELMVLSHAKSTFRRRSVPRGKILSLGSRPRLSQQSVALIITTTKPSNQYKITVEVTPTKTGDNLPLDLSVKILDPEGNCIEKTIVDNSITPAILLEIEGYASERFSVVVSFQSFQHREDFEI